MIVNKNLWNGGRYFSPVPFKIIFSLYLLFYILINLHSIKFWTQYLTLPPLNRRLIVDYK